MKQFKIILFTFLLSFIMAFPAFASSLPDHYFVELEDDNGTYWKYVDNGNDVTNQWVQNYQGNWYYAGANGRLLQNTWFQDKDGKWYYFGDDWAMLHDTTTPDGYTVGPDGAWIQDGQVVITEIQQAN